MRSCLAAGVALVGASLIAVNPVAPTIAADIQEHAVRLTSTIADDLGDLTASAATVAGSLDFDGLAGAAAAASVPGPIGEWVNVFTQAVSNLQQLGGEITADPFPILAQVLHNQLGFANTLGSNLQAMGAGLQPLLTQQLPKNLQTLFSSIAAGHISTGVGTFNTDLLLGLLPIATPLENILAIPGEMAQNLANVLTQQLPNVGLTLMLLPLAASLGTSQAVADGLQSVVDAWGAGQPLQALVDVVNLPAIATGAFVNGYNSTVGIGFSGLLGSSGVFDELLVNIPQSIATTLANGATPATLAGDLSELTATLLSGLHGILNPGAFAAAFTPAAIANIGSLLAANLAPRLTGLVFSLLSLL
ncbi:hypothetical protein BST25_07055 [Mycobacterium heidelbergense]|uniref:PE-PGRS family protein n=1 Tax=Mycobacterium heidelbergense TaxID=53376 RepID=A0A1X0DSQ2_MYCHE|nr:hypothetical protein [Mycobacterium heidelbergense]ORA74880.1 hypothetical protein BST25_07055 [Mycobacterium heidelbergense]